MLHALHYHSSGFFIIMSPAEGLHFSALVIILIDSHQSNLDKVGKVRFEVFSLEGGEEKL